KDAQSLSPAAGEECIDGANTAAQRLANGQSIQSSRSRAIQRPALARAVRAKSVERLPSAVDHPPKQVVSHRQRRSLATRVYGIAIADAARFFQRHGQHRAATKADHLGGVEMPTAVAYLATFSKTARRSRGFHQVADHLHHPSLPRDRVASFELAEVRNQHTTHHGLAPGRSRRRSKKPLSISCNWLLRLISLLPISACSTQ